MAELDNIIKKFDEIGAKIEKDYATKNEVKELKDLVGEIGKARKAEELRTKKHNVFGDYKLAQDFIGHIGNMVENHPKLTGSSDPMRLGINREMFKSAGDGLDQATASHGVVSVPTAVSDQLNILITEYGVARKYLTEVTPIRGNQTLVIASDDAAATFTSDDVTAGSDTHQLITSATISPKQMLAIYRSSGKLVYNSAIDVASMVTQALARACARLEDKTVIYGDGSSTYGSMTGFEDNTNIAVTYVAGISSVTLDDLLSLKYQASEVTDGLGVFYINRELRPILKKIKASTAGSYLIDIQGSNFEIDGAPVVTIHQFHSGSTHGDMVALYGLPKVASKAGVNRDMQVDLDYSVDFTKAGLVWRLAEDFGFAIPNPTAVSKLRVSSSGWTITT